MEKQRRNRLHESISRLEYIEGKQAEEACQHKCQYPWHPPQENQVLVVHILKTYGVNLGCPTFSIHDIPHLGAKDYFYRIINSS